MRDPLLQKPHHAIDPELQTGPVEHRPCRDPFFLIIFLSYIGFMMYIAILGLIQGKPERLLTPFDSSGHQCKYDQADTDYSNYPYVVVWKDQKDTWIGTCVKGCSESQQVECKTNNITNDCTEIQPYDAWTLGSICVPQAVNSQLKDFFNKIGLSGMVQFFQDIMTAWSVIAASIGISLVLSLIYVVLLQQCVGCIVWGAIVLFLVSFGGIGIMMLILPHSEALKNLIHYSSLPPTLQSLDVIKGLGIASISLFSVFLILVLCLARRINTAITIIKAAGDFMKQNCLIILVPIITLLIEALTIMIWILIMLFLGSSGQIRAPEGNSYSPFGWINWSETTRYFIIAQIFGLVWILMFISGAQKYVVSSSVAIWYYQEGYSDKPILKSLPRLVRSLGSIALGSLLLMIVFFLRLILSIVNSQYNKMNKGAQNAAARCALKCCQCLASCFQRFLQFITDKAYIMAAISGKSFCNSAAQGVGITISCIGQSFAVEASTKVFGIVGRLLITGLTTFICLIMITSIASISYNLFSTLGPLLAVTLIGFCVSTIFIQCYRMAAETLLMCYCIQKQFNGMRLKCPQNVRNSMQDYIDESS